MQRYESLPIEDFAQDYNIAEKDLNNWKGLMLHMYKLELL